MNFPFIKTQRLTLRPIIAGEGKDIAELTEKQQQESPIRFYGVEFHTLEDAKIHIDWFDKLVREHKGIWWGISYHSQKDLIGACGFYNLSKAHKKTEIEFWLLPEHWHKGIMTEVLPNIIGYAFEALEMHRIEAFIESDNLFSKELLLKLGFKHEGTMQDCKVKHGKFISLDIFATINL
jgi:ribosomal-protein-alanine N-acetyltransferase